MKTVLMHISEQIENQPCKWDSLQLSQLSVCFIEQSQLMTVREQSNVPFTNVHITAGTNAQ